MADPMNADAWLNALRKEGIKDVVRMTGWRTHNRNHKGPWGPVHGVLVHHTAGTGSGMADFCYRGTGDLPGPLCHDFLAKDGTLYLVGNGRTNHAGTIPDTVRTRLINERMPMDAEYRPSVGAAETRDGNASLYGLEIENRGDGRDPYPERQYDVAVRWAAARCRYHGWTAGSVAGHKEVTRRKIDPSFDMAKFRRDVQARLDGKEEDMALSDADVQKIAEAVYTRIMRHDGVPAPEDAGDYSDDPKSPQHYWAFQTYVKNTESLVRRMDRTLRDIVARLDAGR